MALLNYLFVLCELQQREKSNQKSDDLPSVKEEGIIFIIQLFKLFIQIVYRKNHGTNSALSFQKQVCNSDTTE